MPFKRVNRFQTLLRGVEDMHALSYERLTQFAALMLLAPAVVSEVLGTFDERQADVFHAWVYVPVVLIVTASYFLANFFIARTFQRSGAAGKWPVAIATVSAVMGFVAFIPGAFGLFPSYAHLREPIGDLGFIGMGCVSAYAIGHDLVKARTVTSREVWGSIALYLIVGVTFSYIYGMIANYNPRAFSEHFVAGIDSRSDLIYFSFVTQMTVGFGDILPLSQLARSVVILHSVFGMLYPPILIARLVNLFIVSRAD